MSHLCPDMVYNIRRLAYEIVFESSLVSEIAVSLTTNQLEKKMKLLKGLIVG